MHGCVVTCVVWCWVVQLFMEAVDERTIAMLLRRKIKNRFQPAATTDTSEALVQDYSAVVLPAHMERVKWAICHVRALNDTRIQLVAQLLLDVGNGCAVW